MNNTNKQAVFYEFLPAGAVPYCFRLWKQYNFYFKITRKRNSKLGDYRYDPVKNQHTITVNSNLNPYAFLITYLHEVAHLKVYLEQKTMVAPHGKEWKAAFKMLMEPVLADKIFPGSILQPLRRYMQNPKASTTSDYRLMLALNAYDPDSAAQTPLLSMQPGQRFMFKDKNFQLLEKRKSRVLCLDEQKQKKYLIAGAALVKKL